MSRMLLAAGAAGALLGSLTLSAPAMAQSPEAFYKGKTFSVYAGSEGGGGVDLHARLIGATLAKHIPGKPTVVVRNLPGGSGLVLANWVAKVGPQDGTALAFVTRGAFLSPILGVPQADYDPTKFKWIGAVSPEVAVGFVWSASTKVASMEDAKKEVVLIAATGANNSMYLPLLFNRYLGTQFKIINGYRSSASQNLAIERGEVQGRMSGSWTSLISGNTEDWVRTKKVRVLVQMAAHKHPDLPDVPLAQDLAQSDEGRQVLEFFIAPNGMGWPAFMGPGVPADRVEAMRKAYLDNIKDPELVSAAQKQKMDIDLIAVQDVESIINKIYSLPPHTVGLVKEVLATGEDKKD